MHPYTFNAPPSPVLSRYTAKEFLANNKRRTSSAIGYFLCGFTRLGEFLVLFNKLGKNGKSQWKIEKWRFNYKTKLN